MALVDRHIALVEALRAAGLPVSLTEDLDAVAAVTRLGLADREGLRAGLAATLVKRQSHRPTFDALFDLYFPALLGGGARLATEAEDRSCGVEPGRSQWAGAAGAGRRGAPGRRPAGDAAPRRDRCRAARRHAGSRSRAVGLVVVQHPPGAEPGHPRAAAGTRADGRRQRPVAAVGGDRDAHRDPSGGTVPCARRGRRPPTGRGGPDAGVRRAHDPAAQHRPAVLHLGPPRRHRRDAPPDLSPRPTARDPAGQGAACTSPGTAGLPAYRPGLHLDRRRAAHHPPPAEAAAPDRARRPLRRQRVGGELRVVHAAARLCARASSSPRSGPSRSSTTCTR